MSQPSRPARGSAALARRLRELRESRWQDRPVTQRQLAEALGRYKPLSLSSISAYENEKNPTPPPERRLRDYATFFATERSIQEGRGALVADADLTDRERGLRDSLFAELVALTRQASGSATLPRAEPRAGIWVFPEGDPVRIVCGKLDDGTHRYAARDNLNYTELLSYADLDALVELFGHIRMQNPTCDVRFMLADDLKEPDDLASHLVVLGGIGLNQTTEQVLALTDLPVRQPGQTR